MSEEVRLSEEDYQRIVRGVAAEIKKEMLVLVRAEFESIGLFVSDPEKKIETIHAIGFLKALISGANAAKRLGLKRVASAIYYLIGFLLAIGAGALLQKGFGH